jgi:Xaa-Pro aminopeptidase
MSQTPPTLGPDAPQIAACAQRVQRLQSVVADRQLNAQLISSEKDIQYLTGFVGHDSLAIVPHPSTGTQAIIVSDSRYDEFLNPWRQSGSAEIVMGVRHRLFETVRDLCQKRNLTKLGIQAEHITIAARGKLASAVGESRLVETVGMVSELRIRKDALEIATIERALAIQQEALTASIDEFHSGGGMTELEFSARLEFEMKSRGAHNPSFTPIIGAGPNSSIIHHMTGSSPITPQSGVLLIDWGAMIDGYCGDLTRTFGIGKMYPKIREIYAVVLEAQLAAIGAIAPGKICADIDAVARNVITKAGFGEYFGHGLGHGLGMDVHEAPYFNDLETQTRLQPGMIMTVEPGIYLPGIGGVRIEDDVLITDDGARVLSDYPKDLSSAVIEAAMSGTR